MPAEAATGKEVGGTIGVNISGKDILPEDSILLEDGGTPGIVGQWECKSWCEICCRIPIHVLASNRDSFRYDFG